MAGAQAAWGIDVGVSSLKAIKLRKDGDRVTVEAFEVMEHDKFLTEPDVDRDGLIRGTLGKFMNKYAVRRETVFIGVPGSSTFARFVKLPPVETRKIPEIVRFEAIQQIPFPLDQVNWDFHTFQHPDSPDVEVGIFAMKKELVAQVMSNFQAVDMPVQGVQMSPLAVYNAAFYDGMTADKGTVVIDMGAEHTDLVIMDQGRLWLRTINIGGNHFTDSLAKSFKQPFAKAETLKKTAATSKYQKQIYQSMRPVFADLVAEIQRSIGHYNSTHRDSRLERIVGMGNPFKLPNLQKYLQQELKMDVIRLEHFAKANVEKAAAFSENILSMTAAYGLAIQALDLAPINANLLPTEIARKMMWKKKQPWFIGASAVLFLGAVATAGQYWIAQKNYKNQEDQLNQNNAALSDAQLQINAWKGVPDTYTTDKALIDSAMKLAEFRKLWPSLQLDIVGALPQSPKPHIVLTEVRAEFKGNLPDINLTPRAGDMGAQGGQPAAATPPANAGDAGASPDGDHGFVVTINGYAQGLQPQPHLPVQEYQNTLLGLAKQTGNKPYYFTDAHYTGTPIGAPMGRGGFRPGGFDRGGGGGPGPGGGAPADKVPWGMNKGPYWTIFAGELVGQQAPAAGGMTAITEGPPVDMALPKRPDGNRPPLQGWQFTLRLKVHVK